MWDIPTVVSYKINFCNYVPSDVKSYEEYKKSLAENMRKDDFSEESINQCLKYDDCDECPYCYYDEYMVDDEECSERYCELPREIKEKTK